MFKKILACLDGSQLAEQILPYVEAQASRFGSKVILLQVVGLSSPAFASGATLPLHAGLMAEQVQKEEEAAKAYLERVAQSLKAKGLVAECAIQQGHPIGEMIVNYADQHEIDLIAIATHGHSGLARVVFGSVADFVLKNAGRPILVIRPKEIGEQ
jgi:nucleotide-binding universal stress UspA family protein